MLHTAASREQLGAKRLTGESLKPEVLHEKGEDKAYLSRLP